MWSIPHLGQIWRVQHRPRTLVAGLWRPQYPWLHSADHSMKPTWTRPLPDSHKHLHFSICYLHINLVEASDDTKSVWNMNELIATSIINANGFHRNKSYCLHRGHIWVHIINEMTTCLYLHCRFNTMKHKPCRQEEEAARTVKTQHKQTIKLPMLQS